VTVAVHKGKTLQSAAVNHQVLKERELQSKAENKGHRFVHRFFHSC